MATEHKNTLQSDQIFKVVEAISEGPIVGFAEGDHSVLINGTPWKEEDGKTEIVKDVQCKIRVGTPDQVPFEIVSGIERDEQINGGSGICIVHSKESANEGNNEFDAKRQANSLEATSLRITLGTPAMYIQKKSNGDIVGHEVQYIVQILNSLGNEIGYLNEVKKGKTMSGAQWSHSFKLDRNGPWTIMVKRVTADETESHRQNKLYWYSFTEIMDYPVTYPNTALVCMTGSAQSLGNSVPSRVYKIKGLLVEVPSNYNPETRTYTTEVWDGNFKLAWTDNPAWCFRDLIVNDRYGLAKYYPTEHMYFSRYLSEICDKWFLYEIARYCDEPVKTGYVDEYGVDPMEPRFTFNYQIMGAGAVREVLQSMASTFNGMIYWASGTIFARTDYPIGDPVRTITQADVIDGEFMYSTSPKSARHSVALVTYNPMDDRCEAKILPVYNWDVYREIGYRPINITAYGCTSKGQAYRRGIWELVSEEDSWMCTIKMGLEGFGLLPGDLVKIADPKWMNVRFSGRLAKVDGTKLVLDAPVTLSGTGTYSISVVMPDGKEETRTIITKGNDIDTLYINSTFGAQPVDNAVWSIKSDDVNPRIFRILSIKDLGNGSVEVNMQSYNINKYNNYENGLKFEKEPTRVPSVSDIPRPTDLNVTESSYLVNGQLMQRLTLSWRTVMHNDVRGYEVSYRGPSGLWVDLPETTLTSYDIAPAEIGTYLFMIRTVASDVRKSQWSERTYTTEGAKEVPAAPTNLQALGGERRVTVSWDIPKDNITGHYEVLMSSDSNLENATVVGKIYGSSFTVFGLYILTTYWFWVRAISYADDTIHSDVVGPASAITLALEIEDLPEAIVQESNLIDDLRKPISQIESIKDDLNELANVTLIVENTVVQNEKRLDGKFAAVRDEIITFVDENSSLAQKVTTVEASIERLEDESIPSAIAQVQSEMTATINEEVGSVASSVETVKSQLNGISSAAQQALEASSAVGAKWSVKLDSNGRVAGVSMLNDAQQRSEFTVVADNFFVFKPAKDGQPAETLPIFSIIENQMTLNGTLIVNAINNDPDSGWIMGNKIAADSTITIGSGGSLKIGSGGMIQIGDTTTPSLFLSDEDTGNPRIICKDPLNMTTGDYVEITKGNVTAKKYIGSAYHDVQSLTGIETGVATNGVEIKLNKRYKQQPNVLISPHSIETYDPSYGIAEQTLNMSAGVRYNSQTGECWITPNAKLIVSASQVEINEMSLVSSGLSFPKTGSPKTCTVYSRNFTIPKGASSVRLDAVAFGEYSEVSYGLASEAGDLKEIQAITPLKMSIYFEIDDYGTVAADNGLDIPINTLGIDNYLRSKNIFDLNTNRSYKGRVKVVFTVTTVTYPNTGVVSSSSALKVGQVQFMGGTVNFNSQVDVMNGTVNYIAIG